MAGTRQLRVEDRGETWHASALQTIYCLSSDPGVADDKDSFCLALHVQRVREFKQVWPLEDRCVDYKSVRVDGVDIVKDALAVVKRWIFRRPEHADTAELPVALYQAEHRSDTTTCGNDDHGFEDGCNILAEGQIESDSRSWHTHKNPTSQPTSLPEVRWRIFDHSSGPVSCC